MNEGNISCFRIDYSNDEKWKDLKKRWDVNENLQCSPFMQVIDNRKDYENKPIDELIELSYGNEFIMADKRTMEDDTFAIVDCKTKRIVRFDVSMLWEPVTNLPICNITFEDYFKDISKD